MVTDNELADRLDHAAAIDMYGIDWTDIHAAAARLRELSAEVTGYEDAVQLQHLRVQLLEAENERLRAAGNELARLLHGRHDAVYTVSDDGWVLQPCAKDSCAAWRAALGEDRG